MALERRPYRATASFIAASILAYASAWSAVGLDAFCSDHVIAAEAVDRHARAAAKTENLMVLICFRELWHFRIVDGSGVNQKSRIEK